MARLACESKMAFYPTAIKTIKKVLDKCIEFPTKSVYALDCCAGEGEALEFIGQEYGCSTYAVELDENRAKIASGREIGKVLNADALNGIRKSNHWVGLNFMNPPYGIDTQGNRLELEFVERWGLTTAIGGVLILIINPSSADDKMAEALRKQGYRPMFSFYDENNEDYKKFGQFFLVFQQQLPNFRASLERFYNLFENHISINSDFEVEKILLKTGAKPELFKEIETPRWKIEEQLKKSKLKKVFFDELRQASMLNSSIEHPNQGQAAILIASGALNKKVTLANGDEVILKGTSTKEKKSSSQMDEKGNIGAVKLTDHYKTVVYGLNLTHGQFVKYQ